MLEAAAVTAEERERVYAACLADAPPSDVRRVETAIRRLRQQDLLDPPRPTKLEDR
jgi:hypothetical protein